MLLPALSRAKAKAQRISGINNLKQVGLAARTWALDNSNALPPSFEAMMNELSTDKITYDPNTGQRYVYVGAGKSADNPEAIVAYSPSDMNGRSVVFADGSVQTMSAERFQEALQRDAALPRVAIAVNAQPASPGGGAGAQSASAPDGSPRSATSSTWGGSGGDPGPGRKPLALSSPRTCRWGYGRGRRRWWHRGAAGQTDSHGRAAHPHRGAAHRPVLYVYQGP